MLYLQNEKKFVFFLQNNSYVKRNSIILTFVKIKNFIISLAQTLPQNQFTQIKEKYNPEDIHKFCEMLAILTEANYADYDAT